MNQSLNALIRTSVADHGIFVMFFEKPRYLYRDNDKKQNSALVEATIDKKVLIS